jgi:hypothetical protein
MLDGQRTRSSVPDNLNGKVKVVPLDITCFGDYYFASSAAFAVHTDFTSEPRSPYLKSGLKRAIKKKIHMQDVRTSLAVFEVRTAIRIL